MILPIGQRLIDQLRLVQEFPEASRMAGKMVTGLGRTEAGIDPDEEYLYARFNAVREAPISWSGAGHILLRQFSWDSAILPQKSEGKSLRSTMRRIA